MTIYRWDKNYPRQYEAFEKWEISANYNNSVFCEKGKYVQYK